MFPDLLRDDVFRLETARMWLRWPRMADAPALLRHAGDPAVAHMTASIPHPYTEPDAARWIFSSRAGNAQGSSLVLVMARRGKPTEAIGSVALHQTRPGVALLGYWLGAAFQGKGLATEAVSAIVDLATCARSMRRRSRTTRNPVACSPSAGSVTKGVARSISPRAGACSPASGSASSESHANFRRSSRRPPQMRLPARRFARAFSVRADAGWT